MINLPKCCTIYSTDFIILAVNSFSSKLPIILWGYQLYAFINKSDPLIPINFKIMFNFGLNNPTQMKSDFILSKLPTNTNVPIVDFMDNLKQIDNVYNNSPPWLIIIITICSILVASLMLILLICLKFYFTQCGQKKQEAPIIEMMPMTSKATNPAIHTPQCDRP